MIKAGRSLGWSWNDTATFADSLEAEFSRLSISGSGHHNRLSQKAFASEYPLDIPNTDRLPGSSEPRISTSISPSVMDSNSLYSPPRPAHANPPQSFEISPWTSSFGRTSSLDVLASPIVESFPLISLSPTISSPGIFQESPVDVIQNVHPSLDAFNYSNQFPDNRGGWNREPETSRSYQHENTTGMELLKQFIKEFGLEGSGIEGFDEPSNTDHYPPTGGPGWS
jgi:hypothetical protein